MTKRTYRNTPSPTQRGSRVRPDLFTTPQHFLKHGKAPSTELIRKAAQ